MKRTVEVRVMGQSLAVSSEDAEEHLRKVAELVDAKMREAAGSARSAGSLNVAILAALNIASEYQKLKEQDDAAQRAIDRLSSRVQQWLEE